MAEPPRIYGTAEWGAIPVNTASLRRQPAAGIVVHHTAGRNVQPLPDEAEERERCFVLARGIQAAHLARGWKDSGQHFTVTRSGLILEGRHGSLAAAENGRVIRGAHAGDDTANRTLFGVECEGTYTAELPPEALWTALVELCAWLCLWGSAQSREIHPHRLYRPTQCPGDRFVTRLPALRRAVHDRKLVLMEG